MADIEDDYTGFRERTDYIYQLEKQYNLCREEISKYTQRRSIHGPEDAIRVLLIMIQSPKILSQAKMKAEEFQKSLEACEGIKDPHERILAQFKLAQDLLDKADLLGLQKTGVAMRV